MESLRRGLRPTRLISSSRWGLERRLRILSTYVAVLSIFDALPGDNEVASLGQDTAELVDDVLLGECVVDGAFLPIIAVIGSRYAVCAGGVDLACVEGEHVVDLLNSIDRRDADVFEWRAVDDPFEEFPDVYIEAGVGTLVRHDPVGERVGETSV